MTEKRPRIKPGKNRCIYVTQIHGVAWTIERKIQKGKPISEKPCGKLTGNNGHNRYFCAAHHKAISGGMEI